MGKYKIYPGVKGKVQQFNEELLKKFDEPARKKVKEVLGDFVIDNPDPYAQDMIIKSDNCKYKYLELQVCNQWITEPYPYARVYIYARKIKYDNDTLFLTLSKNMQWGYLFDTSEIKKYDIQPRRFKKYSREFVYDIPWHRVTKVYMKTLDTLTFELL